MSEEEKFDAWLRDVAQDYHRPPSAVPREPMWDAIRLHAAGATLADAAPSREAPVLAEGRSLLLKAAVVAAEEMTRSAPRSWIVRPWQYAAAAVLVLLTGISIGRGWSTTGQQHASPPTLSRTVPPTATVYDIASTQHFSRAEALLTSFRSSGANDSPASMDRWARDLLGDTRLLLDSPAAADPQRRLLLEDLELVLAQIVQLPTESSIDHRLVRRALERGEVLSRIRSTIPAGANSGT